MERETEIRGGVSPSELSFFLLLVPPIPTPLLLPHTTTSLCPPPMEPVPCSHDSHRPTKKPIHPGPRSCDPGVFLCTVCPPPTQRRLEPSVLFFCLWWLAPLLEDAPHDLRSARFDDGRSRGRVGQKSLPLDIPRFPLKCFWMHVSPDVAPDDVMLC